MTEAPVPPAPITTTRAEMRDKIVAAIADGTLAALHGIEGRYAAPTPAGNGLCFCAIGVQFPPEQALAMEGPSTHYRPPNYMFASDLFDRGYIITPDPEEDQCWADRLQGVHDAWAARERQKHETFARSAKDHFMRVLHE